jgi:hypothetical protein
MDEGAVALVNPAAAAAFRARDGSAVQDELLFVVAGDDTLPPQNWSAFRETVVMTHGSKWMDRSQPVAVITVLNLPCGQPAGRCNVDFWMRPGTTDTAVLGQVIGAAARALSHAPCGVAWRAARGLQTALPVPARAAGWRKHSRCCSPMARGLSDAAGRPAAAPPRRRCRLRGVRWRLHATAPRHARRRVGGTASYASNACADAALAALAVSPPPLALSAFAFWGR